MFYDVELASMFLNNASEYCSLESIQIYQVEEKSTGAIVESYDHLFSFDEESGFFSILSYIYAY